MKRYIFITALALSSLNMGGRAMANSFSMYLRGGVSSADLNSDQTIWLNSSVANRYTSSNDISSTSFYGFGVAYQLDQPIASMPQLALRLGLTGYALRYNLAGTNAPFVNVGSFDTLNYHINESSRALMFEPTFIYTANALQPYFTVGIGAALNRLSNYSESPTDPNGSAAPMLVPFRNKTIGNCAYSIGVGIQYMILTAAHTGNLGLALEYRYMNWGNMALSTYPGQATDQTLEFGELQTNLFGISLIWKFS